MPGRKHRVKEDVREFCGYDFLIKIIEVARFPMLQALIVLLFETGGRVNEVLKLRKSNFSSKDKYEEITISVSKRYKKVGKVADASKKSGYRWITERLSDFRTIPILKTSPLLSHVQNYLKTLDGDSLLFPITRQTAFYRIRDVGRQIDPDLELYPHWFRAQKASQLASEYGFDIYDLKQFFRWIDDNMAEFYASLGAKGLAKKMGAT